MTTMKLQSVIQHLPGAHMLQLLLVFVGILGLGASRHAMAQNISEISVQLTATNQTSPPSITLHWPSKTGNGYTVYRRALGSTNWGSTVATLASSATSYTDSNVAVGPIYEYQVLHSNADGSTGYGYTCAGIEATLVENRGKLILIVDNTMSAPLVF